MRNLSAPFSLSMGLLAMAAAAPALAQPCPDVRDVLLTNGAIHTMDASDTVVESVRIVGDRVAAVGGGRLGATRCTRVIDLEGRTAVPGLIDNHNHIVLLGLRPGHDTRLESAASIADALTTLRAKAATLPDGEWITSIGGFDINQFVPPPGAPRFPTLAELDSVTPNHPVYLQLSFGGPSVGAAADVVDAAGNSVRGEVGELVLRQPLPGMTRGFWHDRERYLESYWSRIPGTWVHGDWALVDADGYWFIQGRSDDTLKVAGKRVGPAEVESAAVAHPAVLEAAAVGVPHDVKGEVIVVFVRLRPGETDDPELRRSISDRVVQELGKALRPEAVHVVSDLPRTGSGKVMRRVARAAYLGADPGDLSALENPLAVESIRATRLV